MSRRLDQLFSLMPVEKPVPVPGGYPVHEFEAGTLEAEERIGEFLRLGGIELLRRGQLRCRAYVFCTRDPFSQKSRDVLYTTAIRGDVSERDAGNVKDLFVHMVGGVAMFGAARGVSFCMETRLHAVGDTVKSALPEQPGSFDALMVTLETAQRQHAWIAKIRRFKGRGVSVGAFLDSSAGTAKGRFFGVMKAVASGAFDDGL